MAKVCFNRRSIRWNWLFCVCGMTILPGCDFLAGNPCGGITGIPCLPGYYCHFPEGSCGDGDQTGVCRLRPSVCLQIFDPVCGCDGETYGNDCQAAAAGVSVASLGGCEDEVPFCGGIAGFVCDEGEYCKFETGTCGSGDQAGECKTVPDVCAEIFAPVCGCDSRTYGNECEAEAAGVSVLSEGQCP